MPEWKRLVQQQLARLRLPPESEMEIAEELAERLESVYNEALAGGLTPEAARARALEEIAGWPALAVVSPPANILRPSGTKSNRRLV